MKLSEIIKRVQRQFGDDVQAQITKEDIVRWVNDACLEITTNNYTNQGILKGHTPVVVGQAEYKLPPDLLLLRSVRANGIKLTHTTYDQLTELNDFSELATGAPTCYWVYDNKLHVYPTPYEALGTIDVYYSKSPDILTVEMLEREPDVPKQYHPRIVEYCIAQAAELDDNMGTYQYKMNQFEKNLQSLKANGEQPEGDDYYPSITYMGDGNFLREGVY